jgi:hypothetical protein
MILLILAINDVVTKPDSPWRFIVEPLTTPLGLLVLLMLVVSPLVHACLADAPGQSEDTHK